MDIGTIIIRLYGNIVTEFSQLKLVYIELLDIINKFTQDQIRFVGVNIKLKLYLLRQSLLRHQHDVFKNTSFAEK